MKQQQIEFKELSTIAQSLAKDCSQSEVKDMLDELRKTKERLIQVEKDAIDRLKQLKSIFPQMESLENGLADLNKWLDGAEEVLNSHQIAGDIMIVEKCLDQHKVLSFLLTVIDED